MAAKLRLVPDRRLDEFIRRYWGQDLRHAGEESAELVRHAALACERIAQVADEKLRRTDFRVQCK
jgi:hypothetical protein